MLFSEAVVRDLPPIWCYEKADKAEFTHRNVQTADGRKTTVYAIKILVPNDEQSLKPGMPVDVEF